MAIVKVKLRPSSVEGKAGVIYYQVTHNRKTQQITAKLRVQPSDWDVNEEKLVSAAPNRSMIQNRIDSDIALLRRVISDLDISGMNYSVEDVISRYKSPQCHILVLDYIRAQIEQLRAANRLGTAKNYEKTMCSFSEFLGDVRLPLSAMTEQVITDYNAFLVKRGLVRNSVSFYMRVLRAVYNKAVRQKLIEQRYPFMEVYTGIDRTRRRAVSESIIANLHRLELEAGSPLALCRDMFVFSYCTRGMSFVDMAYLRKKDLQKGVLSYRRRKTGQQLFIKWKKCMQEIVDKYDTSQSNYLLPIIKPFSDIDERKQYIYAAHNINRCLKIIGKELGLSVSLTLYVARHAWASIAKSKNVPLSVISEGMGHDSEATTRIYLASLDTMAIDKANSMILKSL